MTEYGTGELFRFWLKWSCEIFSFDTDDEYESVESEGESIERYIEVVVAFCVWLIEYCPVGNLALFEIVEIDAGEPGELGSSWIIGPRDDGTRDIPVEGWLW